MIKQTKSIVFTAIVTLLTLGTVVYTSCKKDHCKNLVCQHGGTCNNGFCLCATGFTGNFCEVPNAATIGFKNRTFATVSMNIGGIDYRIDSGKTLVMTGGFGDTLAGNAYAHGAYGVNAFMPSIKVGYLTSGNYTYNLDVDSNYFYLKVINANATVPYITQVHVNYKQRDSTIDIVQIPNDNSPHGIGYYRLYTDTHVHLQWNGIYWNFNTLGLLPTTAPNNVNLSYTAVAN
jgi:hypothetical protein